MASRPRQHGAADYDYLIKLLLIGDSGVGKSCLLLRFAEDSFTPSFITTIGIDFKIKKVMIDGKSAKLQIWDTAGQERFRTITTAYYRGAMGILLVYDVTDESSFNNVRNWMRNIEAHASDGVNKLLVGNKADCDSGGAGGAGGGGAGGAGGAGAAGGSRRAVPFSRGQALADEFGIPFIETSAKDGSHVSDAFLTIARDVMARLGREAAEHGGGGAGGDGGGGIRLGGSAPARGRGGGAGARGACCSGA